MKRLMCVVTSILVLVGVAGCAPEKIPPSYSPPPKLEQTFKPIEQPIKPAEITVREITANPLIATWGEVITITAKFVNAGDVQGTYLAILLVSQYIPETLKLTGETQYETSVTVPGKGTEYVSFQMKGAPGIYNASVGGMNIGLRVAQPKTLPPVYVPPMYIPPLTGQDNYQLDELRRQQQQQQQEIQRLQEEQRRLAEQRRQQREYYLGLAKQYEDMAQREEAGIDIVAGFGDSKEVRKIQQEHQEKARYYRSEAAKYRFEANKYQ